MNRDALREVQQPLKTQYRQSPDSATIVLHATGVLDDGVSCSVETGRGLAAAGLHPATGGDGGSVCSGDMLLQALVACAGVTLKAVALSRDLDVAGSVEATGDLDVRGTLGLDPDVPVGFVKIGLTFHLQSTASAEALDALVSTTERYCVVLQTIIGAPQISVSRAPPAADPGTRPVE